MKASLDTNVIIHLYSGNQQEILFDLFDEGLYIYEFLVNVELKNHGESIIPQFQKDVDAGRIKIVTDEWLRSCGIYTLFLEYYQNEEILYAPSDKGEVFAIALAKTLGAMCIVTDDTKQFGPHATLMRIPESEVMPFSFVEVLFLLFISGKLTAEAVIDKFNTIIAASNNFSWRFENKLKDFVRRFAQSPYSAREKEWMSKFCTKNLTTFRGCMRELNNQAKVKTTEPES